MAGEKITIDISILQGIFGDLTRLQQQLAGATGGAMAMDGAATSAFADIQRSIQGATGAMGGMEAAFDSGMRNMVGDIMAPLAKTQELEAKLRDLGERVRTAKSVKEITALNKEIAATQKELDGVKTGAMEQKVGGAAARMRSLFSGLAAPIAGAFAVGGITAFGSSVMKAAADAQAYSTALEVMLQDKGKADAMVAQVKEFAATTPFELPQVQAASQQLLAFGFDSARVVPQLTTLGNVASALNQPIGDIAYLFGTARVQGRLYTNDLMQFMNRGIPIVSELSKVLGVSEAQVKKLTEEGKVGFEDLEKAMENLGGAGGRFDGLMDRQSKTIGGTLSNLSDAWGQFKSDLGLSLAPVIEGGIAMLSNALGGLRKAMTWVMDHGDQIRTTIEVVGLAVGTYTTLLVANNSALIWNRILQGQAGAAAKLKALWLGLTTGAVRGATAAQWSWNAALTANPIGIVILAIGALVAAVVYAWRNCEGFRNAVLQLWEKVKPVFEDLQRIGEQVFGAIMEIAGELWAVLSEVFNSIVTAFREAWNSSETFRDVVKGVFEFLKFTTLLTWRVIAAVLSAYAKMLSWVAEHSEGLRQAIMGMWYGIKEAFTLGWEVIKDVFGAIVDAAEGAGKVIQGVFNFDWKLMKEGAAQQIDVLKRSFNGILDAPDRYKEAGIRMAVAVGEGMKKGSEGYRASMERRAAGLNALNVAPEKKAGDNVGAEELLGATGDGAGAAGKGATVGGGDGGGRTITMNIKMTNTFNLPRDGNMGARDAAERIVGALVNKLNDAQFAMG